MNERQVGRPRTIDPEAVSRTALRLFDERGYDVVSMDEVAEAAGVSRRYLFRLFPTKAALVWGGLDEFTARLRAALAATDPSSSAEDALRTAYRQAATFPDDAVEVTRHRLRVIAEHPALASEGSARVTRTTEELITFIAERRSVPADELAVAVAASAVAAAAGAALRWWALHSAEAPEDVVALALATVHLGG